MSKIVQGHHQVMKVLKQRPSPSKATCLLMFLAIGLCLLVTLNACALDTQSTKNMTPVAEDWSTETALPPEDPLSVNTPTPSILTGTVSSPILDKPTLIPPQTLQPDSGTRVIGSTATAESETRDIRGHLFIYDPVGIQKVTLADNTSEYLLTVDADWPDWRASFAQNRKYLAYSIKSPAGTELWFTLLPHWQPELLLVVDDVDYDFATPLWRVNDRYLLFDLSIIEEGEIIDEIKSIRTYIIDTRTMELVTQPYWPGNCSVLAPSPQTGQLAIWCDKISELQEAQEFLVLELNEDPWLTQQAPKPLAEKCFSRRCVWSSGGESVAYVEDDYPQLLYFTSVNDPTPIRLDDKRTDSDYGFPLWSPDGQFLYYTGACVNHFQKPSVMAVASQEIIWCITDTSNRGEYGSVSVVPVRWSPDSRYLAIPITPYIETEILILDISTQQDVARIAKPKPKYVILDMVWVND